MSWKNILKTYNRSDGTSIEEELFGGERDGSETDFQQFKNPPKGEKRIKIIKDVFDKIYEADDILNNAVSWSSPDKHQEMMAKISNLLKEIKGLEKEAIEHHSRN